MTIEELHLEEIRLLKELAAITEKENLRFYAAEGTLLGAIRHHGFIPWDDDIDVVMLREDFTRLMQVKPRGVDCHIMDMESKDYPWSFGKLTSERTSFKEPIIKKEMNDYGVYVDIFPLDVLPKNGARLLYARIRLLTKLHLYAYVYDFSNERLSGLSGFIRKYAGKIIRLIPEKRIKDRIRSLACSVHAEKGSTKGINFFSLYSIQREIVNLSDYDDYEMALFESVPVRVPKNCESTLEQIYGSDWRIPIKHEAHIHGEAKWLSETLRNRTLAGE